MAIGRINDSYRLTVDDSWRFAQDEVILKIAKRTPDGLIPIKLTITEGSPISDNVAIDDEMDSSMPRELAELFLAAFARYFLSAEGDIVLTNKRLARELEHVTKQLESLISGIGRLGSSQ